MHHTLIVQVPAHKRPHDLAPHFLNGLPMAQFLLRALKHAWSIGLLSLALCTSKLASGPSLMQFGNHMAVFISHSHSQPTFHTANVPCIPARKHSLGSPNGTPLGSTLLLMLWLVYRTMAICNLLVSPFLLVFLFIYFFLRNAEKLYHHPSSVGARRWSALAAWRMREFNELPHYLHHRSGQTRVHAGSQPASLSRAMLSHWTRTSM